MTTARELIAALRLPRGGGRGRPRGRTAAAKERQRELYRQIWRVIDGPRQWGALSLLQRTAKRKYGIASSEFYIIVHEARLMHRATRELIRQQDLIERHITSAEWDKWQHRDGYAIFRLARRRSRRV
jgi:hypothetical protein